MNELQVARDLREAASYLREHGWRQGGLADEEGRVCLGGALVKSQRLNWGDLTSYATALGFSSPTSSWPACVRGNLIEWNDTTGRTVEEVLDRLESTALALEIRHLAAQAPMEVVTPELVTA